MANVDPAHFASMFVRRAGPTLISSAAASTIWNCPAGKRIVLKGAAIRARVTTALVGATPGDTIALCETSVASGAILPIGTIITATDVAGTDYGHVYTYWPGGYALTAGQNLRIGVGAVIGGTITVIGLVWGDEVQAPT
jgi:hypothetical protein